MKNLLSMEALTVHEIEHLLEQAAQFKRGKKRLLMNRLSRSICF